MASHQIHTLPEVKGTTATLYFEIQLQTNLSRELNNRVNGILEVFRVRGYDSDLLKVSLSHEHYNQISNLLPGL